MRKADVRLVESWQEGDLSGSGAVYDVRGETVTVRFASAGVTNAINGAAAIAACLPLDVTADDIAEGIESFSPMKGRLEVIDSGGFTIIDDTYNANPASVLSALGTLCASNGGRRRVAVLGEMLELGEGATVAHREAGRTAGALGADVVVGVGAYAGEITGGALSGGLVSADVFDFPDRDSAIEGLPGILREGDVVLVKGSRGAALEHIVDALRRSNGAA
jgi:UDP-N-acetylmuramoyl-tripeptide--D-alanyl-D-alanine ligase